MNTFIAVLFGMFFGFILTKGFIMIFKKNEPTKKSGNGGGSYFPSEEEDKDDDLEQLEKY